MNFLNTQLVFILLFLSNSFLLGQKPNVIIVITDDQGYGDLGHTGNPIIQTPNLDAFSAQSVNLTDFHMGTTCSPSRAGLMTGRNGNRSGVWHTIKGASMLSKDEVTLADLFKNDGYSTGLFGKWHLGDNHSLLPNDRGFQEAYYHGGGGIGQMPDYWNNDYFDDTYFRNGRPESATGYCTDVFFSEAMDFIEDKQDEPFFCYLSLNAPHAPFRVPDSYRNLYANQNMSENLKKFYGMITNIDENFGLLLDKLDDLGIADNTIIIFTTDNGTALGHTVFNASMQGNKGSEYEGGHRVPFIIRWPDGNLDGGISLSELTGHVDILPTLTNMAGVSRNPGIKLDGKDIGNYLKGIGTIPERVLIADTQRELNLIEGKRSCVMKNKWRLVNGNQLYNISTDPNQSNNITSQHPNIVQELNNSYDNWWADVIAESELTRIDLGVVPHEVLWAHDIRSTGGLNHWNQSHVLNGSVVTPGPWLVNFVEAGTYTFSLRRWPEENGGTLPNSYAKAFININGATKNIQTDPSKETATFSMTVAKGAAEITAYFETTAGVKTNAFYLVVDNDLSTDHIAIGKPTSQSSTIVGGVSARAVDGNANGNWGGNSVTHTKYENNSWWKVDLEDVYELSSIKIHNRTNSCCTHRMKGAELYAGNINSTNPNDYTLIGTLDDLTVNPFTDLGIIARYIMVRRNGILSLAEVEVHGTLSSGGATLYNNCNYGGRNISLGEGEYPDISALDFPNDALSSLKVANNFEVILYEHKSFNGASVSFTADDNCLINNNFNDKTGSVKVINKLKATLYKHCSYNGTSVSLGVGEYPNMPSVELLNDDVSSLKVPAGLQVTLYSNINFGGASITFTADDNCLINNNFNDKTGSFKIEAPGADVRSTSQALILSPEFGRKTLVNWIFRQETTNEVKQYTVLHGTSGEAPLQEVGVIAATDYLGAEAYRFLHQEAQEGKNYYQIMVEYEDGSIVYPMWDDISFEAISIPLSVAPNPASDYLQVDVSKYLNQKIKYSIVTTQGIVIADGQYEADHEETLELDLATLQNGMYIIHLQAESNRAVAAKFMVTKEY